MAVVSPQTHSSLQEYNKATWSCMILSMMITWRTTKELLFSMMFFLVFGYSPCSFCCLPVFIVMLILFKFDFWDNNGQWLLPRITGCHTMLIRQWSDGFATAAMSLFVGPYYSREWALDLVSKAFRIGKKDETWARNKFESRLLLLSTCCLLI